MKLISQVQNIKQNAYSLAQSSDKLRNLFLSELIKQLRSHKREIFAANKKDLIQTYKKKLSDAFVSRLQFGGYELKQLIAKVEAMKQLDAHLFEKIEQKKVDSGLVLLKLRVPIGVVFIIYESRPDVTIEAVCLSIKSGNGVVLRGGSDAISINNALYKCIKNALRQANIPDTVFFIEDCNRVIVYQLLQANQYIDLVIARGGYEMVRDVQNRSKIPVLAHAAGGARIYVDRSADLEMALQIILNAKLSKPAACNSVDTVLVHKEIADNFLPELVKKLEKKNVITYINFKPRKTGDSSLRSEQVLHHVNKGRLVMRSNSDEGTRLLMDKELWSQEFLGKEIAIKIVADYEQALLHIQKYSKGHTECIIAADKKVIDAFIHSVDAASLLINCSTRLHDGFIFGLGAEMGIATGRLHVRGPVGLEGLTTYKWIVKGKGQIRE